MFDIGSILKRSWNILWNYKALWVFALLLVLSGGAGSSGSSGGSGSSVNVPAAGNPIFGQNELNQNYGQFNEFGRELEFWAQENVYPFFATEEVAMTWPDFCARNSGSTAATPFRTPLTLTSTI